ncbi:glutathione S-transferase family protein [Sphingobium limneticum]|jgi:glutathione S-transferase|uniref:glutathione S-transferase family protein n=1 Tax=Sphingobium limneticum TaxID=1007511 RepID=UPI003D060CF1
MTDISFDPAYGALALHGYPVSNYFNAARAALIEKGAAFTIVPTRAAQDEAFLAHSAMGKIPYLRTGQGCIAETVAILEYIEEVVPGVPLYPAGALARARARQIINIVQLYVETPLRSLYPGAFMGGVNAPETIAAVRPVVYRGMRALSQLVTPAPFLLGGQLTYADIFAFYHFDLGARAMRFTYGASLFDAVPGLHDWFDIMAARPSTRTVLADFHPAFAAYLRDKGAAWLEPELKETTHA